MLKQKVLFTQEEALSIRGYTSNLQDRVIHTYHPDINNGEHDYNGGHNSAQHLPWSSSTQYTWMYERILNWVQREGLPINTLGWEFIVQKYYQGYEFKPHIDDVLGRGNNILRKRYYTILIQLAGGSEYTGGELWVNENQEDIKISNNIGNVCIFGDAQIHWVTPIKSGERWSTTIFLEEDALKKSLI